MSRAACQKDPILDLWPFNPNYSVKDIQTKLRQSESWRLRPRFDQENSIAWHVARVYGLDYWTGESSLESKTKYKAVTPATPVSTESWISTIAPPGGLAINNFKRIQKHQAMEQNEGFQKYYAQTRGMFVRPIAVS